MPNVKKLLIYFFLGLFVISALIYVTNPNIIKDLIDNKREAVERDSAFSKLNEETGIPTAVSVGFEEFFAKNHDSTGTGENNPWENWNWEETPIFASFAYVNEKDRSVNLDVTLPLGMGALENVKVSCTNEETASFYKENLEFLDANFDMFEKDFIVNSIGFYAFCLNEKCSEVGRSCVLIDKVR